MRRGELQPVVQMLLQRSQAHSATPEDPSAKTMNKDYQALVPELQEIPRRMAGVDASGRDAASPALQLRG